MPDREKVMLGIEACANSDIMMHCSVCPYYEIHQRCVTTMMRDALALLKEQEARVLTIDNIETLLHKGSDVFIERRGLGFILPATVFRVGRNFIEFYGALMSERFDRYNRFWRLWTNRPTDDQRKAAVWNG